MFGRVLLAVGPDSALLRARTSRHGQRLTGRWIENRTASNAVVAGVNGAAVLVSRGCLRRVALAIRWLYR